MAFIDKGHRYDKVWKEMLIKADNSNQRPKTGARWRIDILNSFQEAIAKGLAK